MRVRDVERAFTRKLGADRDDSGDHVYFYFSLEGSDYTVAKLSHSWSGDLNDTQVTMLARKLHLRRREFEDFVACPLAAKDMVSIWRNRRPQP